MSDRKWICPICGEVIDRDYNAACNIKDEGMKITDAAIKIIKNSKKIIGYEHGLTNSFKASEAINPRQYKEVHFNIGTKPTSDGSVYPYIINKSFSKGGVNDPLSYFIESSGARLAQILSKTNVGDSGDFARLLGLNNIDSIINPEVTRKNLIYAFEMLFTKREDRLNKKHGTV